MASDLSINVNGRSYPVEASPDTPLLYVLSNELSLRGPRFGCGLAQCGSCSVLLDGVEVRSSRRPLRPWLHGPRSRSLQGATAEPIPATRRFGAIRTRGIRSDIQDHMCVCDPLSSRSRCP